MIAAIVIGFKFPAVRGQDQVRIAELRQRLSMADSVQRYGIWCDLAFEYRKSFPDSTIHYGQKAHRLGKELGLKTGLARSLSFIGIGYGAKGDRKNSFEFHEQAIRVAFSQKDSLQVGYAYNNMGRLFLDAMDQDRAETNFRNAIEVFKRVDDRSGMAYALRSLSEVELHRRNHQGALMLARQALDIREKGKDVRAVVSSLLEMGSIHQAMGSRSEEWGDLKSAMEKARLISDPETHVEVQLALASYHLRHGDPQEGLQALTHAAPVVERLANEMLLLQYLLLSARIDSAIGRNPEGLTSVKTAMSIAERAQDFAAEKELLELWIGLNERSGRGSENTALRKILEQVEEKINRREQARETERLYFLLLVERGEKENQDLSLKLAKEEIQIARQRSRSMLMLVVALILLCGFVLSYLFLIRQRRLNAVLLRQNEHILEQEEKIRNSNQLLEAQNEELQALAAEKDSLMSVVAHDLRSPLNRIMALAELMELRDGDASRRREYLEKIRGSVDAGNRLIRDILDSNQYRLGDELTPAAVDLERFAADKKREFAPSADGKGIFFEVESSSGEFVTDADFLNRICENLISNAIKFTRSGGRVAVRLISEPSQLLLEVSDSGPGFTESDRAMMFRQFRKLSAQPTGGESSTGLGLAIVKTLVERLQGSITLDSSPGKGSKFLVMLPGLGS